MLPRTMLFTDARSFVLVLESFFQSPLEALKKVRKYLQSLAHFFDGRASVPGPSSTLNGIKVSAFSADIDDVFTAGRNVVLPELGKRQQTETR